MLLESALAPEARVHWRRTWRRRVHQQFRPRPTISVSEWAEQERVVSKGPHAGQPWSNEMIPYLVEIMDVISSQDRPRTAVVMKSTRVGYTEGVIGNGICYEVDQVGCDVIAMQPSDKEADAYSKEQITPMIEKTPAISRRLDETKWKDRDNTLGFKNFKGGGSLLVIGISPKSLRRRSARTAFADEIDVMESDAAEGDPIRRLQKRLDDYEDSLLFLGSTPTIKGLSRIEKEYARSDQRRYQVPCPHCGEFQILRWGGPDAAYGIKWAKDVSCGRCGEALEVDGPCPKCEATDRKIRHLPETAYYLCSENGCVIEEMEKPAMIAAGRWVAEHPESRIPGWHINALISLFAGAMWPKLVDEFLDSKDNPEDLQVFVNTVLGETFEERGQVVDPESLEHRGEAWVDADGEPVDFPDGVGLITAAVDVQGDRLELELEGWGVGQESWKVHHRLYGDPDNPEVWQRLEAYRVGTYLLPSGARLPIACMMIDAGYNTVRVYQWVKPRQGQNTFASMGDKGARGNTPLTKASRANRDGVKRFTIGTFALKSALMARLRRQTPGPGYVHFSKPTLTGTDAEYFAQFKGEKMVSRRMKGSRKIVQRWVQTRDRNEAIDLGVLNLAALMALGEGVTSQMAAWVEAARNPKEVKDADPWASEVVTNGEGSKW